MTYNSKTVPVKISRSEICDFLFATKAIARELEETGYIDSVHKWEALHDKLKEQLAAFDAKDGVDNA